MPRSANLFKPRSSSQLRNQRDCPSAEAEDVIDFLETRREIIEMVDWFASAGGWISAEPHGVE